MNDTVRKRILDAVMTALAAVPDVGLVADAAERFPGSDEAGIGQCVAEQHKHAVEVIAFDDEPDEAHGGTDVEAWAFTVVCVVHLSDDLAGPPPLKPYAVAADVAGDIYAMYRGPAADPTWGGLAVDTEPLGGWGVALSDLGTRETAALFRVRYRHTVGDPTQPR